MQNHSLRESDCLRLVGLFVLRYEGQFKGGEVEKLMRRLEQRGISEQKRRVSYNNEFVENNDIVLQLIYALMDHCGQAKRSGQLFDSANPMSSAKKFFKGLRVSDGREWVCVTLFSQGRRERLHPTQAVVNRHSDSAH